MKFLIIPKNESNLSKSKFISLCKATHFRGRFIRSSVYSVKCSFGQMFIRSSVDSVKCSFGQVFVRSNSH